MMKLEIKPKSKVKIFFWSDPYRLPKKEQDLAFFKKKGIKFVIALGFHTIKPKLFNKIEILADNEIEINICLLDKDYAHLDNSNKFNELYNRVKSSKIFDKINEIYIDAEIASSYRKKIRELSLDKKISFVINNYPYKREYKDAIKDYNKLIETIHNDGKKFGIIRSQKATYELEKLTRNIPFKELNPDLTITMVYRVPEGKKREYSDLWFYQNAKRESSNIFLGDIKDGYRSLKKDITICSYLKKRRVYIYDYYGFQKFNKFSDLKPFNSYKLKFNVFDSIKNNTKISGMNVADKFLKLFKIK